jgi:predicted AlkP superfamily pyrophosphatase or phosphodiesterase
VVRSRRAVLFLLLALAVVASAQRTGSRDPLLILVSVDGWRWDYIDRVNAPHLATLAARGVRARELIPVFPTLTFPNHYTLVTGLYPAHHGIVANTMAEPGFPERFSMSADTAKDARWWGGEPVWVTAIRQGRAAGAMFWPGSEAAIRGVRPTYWRPYDEKYPNDDRIDTVLGWLALPPGRQPAVITLYFSDVDHAGHEHGPESSEVQLAAARVDAALGRLLEGIKRQELENRVNIVVVSDHGMAPLSDERLIFLDEYIDLNTIDIIDFDSLLQIVPRPGTSDDDVYRRLRGRVPHVSIYKKADIPDRLRYRDNPRIAPIVGIADVGWIVTSRARQQRRVNDGLPPRAGGHGYPPQAREMHGLFVAAGPAVRQGLVVEPFENIHVYEFLCAILELKPSKNDGDAAVTRPFLARER